MWNPNDERMDEIEGHFADFPTDAELEALFWEINLIDLLTDTLNEALDHLFATQYTPTAA